MRNRAMIGLWTLALTGVCPLPGWADDGAWSIGVAAGLEFDGSDRFEQYDMVAARRLPWSWPLSDGWTLGTRLELTAGALVGPEDEGFIGSIGPALVLQTPWAPLSIAAGVRAALLSRHEFDGRDLGGPFQFVSHLALDLALSSQWSLSYGYQHISNANLYHINPGIDVQLLTLAYHF